VPADEPTGQRGDDGERLARIRAAAIRLDSTPAVVRAVEGLRRRLPGDDRFGDSLSTDERKPVSLLAAVYRRSSPTGRAPPTSSGSVPAIEVAGHRPRMRCGVHRGRPRRLGGDYLGVDVNVAARVAAAAKGDQLLVSAPACELLEDGRDELGRAKLLREKGTPTELRVHSVSQA
jgi:hypothetical protein